MATTRIYRTPASASAGTIWTVSMWIKGGATSANQILFSADTGGSFTFRTYVELQSSGVLNFGGVDNGNTNGSLATTRVFRDPSAWYHLVFVWDNANATSADKMIIYVNGVRETAVTYTAPTTNSRWNMNNRTEIGSRHGGDRFFSGEMSHVHNCDGYAYAASDFGETDATDGMWKIKTAPSVSYGTNGFFLKMEDSSNMDLDSSSNGHTFTTAGTLTATNDNPDNNMSTLSPLIPFPSGLTMTNGNTSIASTATQWAGRYSTQRVFSGKYYVEAQFVSTGDNFKFGVQGFDVAETANWSTLNTSYAGKSAVGYEYQCNNGSGYKVNNNSSPTWTNANFTPATSTIMMAFDLDNGKIWWGRNGTWFNTSGTANPATGTDAAFTGISTDNSPYLFGLSLEGNGSSSHINFGNGYFGTTAIGSPVTSNEGTWAYAPPTGFGAVNTKWINTF